MKPKIWLTVGILVLTLFVGGCGEQEKEAEKRGKIPKETIKKAEDAVNNAVKSMEDKLKKAGEELDK